MQTPTIAALVALVLIIGGGLYYNYGYPEGEVMMEKGEAMIEKGDAMMEKGDAMMEKGEAMMEEGKKMQFTAEDGTVYEGSADGATWTSKGGTYESYAAEKLARAADGPVVLFFRASWCPTCRALDADIKKNSASIPEGVTILDVNYDDSSALKKQYGVTAQHTLVQVNADGSMITKWSGSGTLAEVLARIKK